jgi:hypothetical protein
MSIVPFSFDGKKQRLMTDKGFSGIESQMLNGIVISQADQLAFANVNQIGESDDHV